MVFQQLLLVALRVALQFLRPELFLPLSEGFLHLERLLRTTVSRTPVHLFEGVPEPAKHFLSRQEVFLWVGL